MISSPPFLDEVFEFYDFGCSNGNSIAQARKLFSAERGLGLDIAESKVQNARSKGFEAENFDILALPEHKQVRFTTMVHFLEHLESGTQAAAFLRKAAAVSREFVFIRQPYFDADGALLERGFKCYWSDWRGHRFTMSTLEMHRILSALLGERLIRGFQLGWYRRIESSTDDAILPLNAPSDQHQYDTTVHGAKNSEAFPFPVYQELRALVDTGNADRSLLRRQVYMGHVVSSGGWN